MGGFLGLGGDARKTDRKYQLGGYEDLKNLFNSGMGVFGKESAAGEGDLGAASNYEKSILSGDRSSVEQAVAPEIGAVTSEGQMARNEAAAEGTNRGGGTNGALQDVKGAESGKVQDLIFGARPSAAKAETAIGGTEMQAALNALGISENDASNLTKIAEGSRSTSEQINQGIQQQWGQLAGIMLGL